MTVHKSRCLSQILSVAVICGALACQQETAHGPGSKTSAMKVPPESSAAHDTTTKVPPVVAAPVQSRAVDDVSKSDTSVANHAGTPPVPPTFASPTGGNSDPLVSMWSRDSIETTTNGTVAAAPGSAEGVTVAVQSPADRILVLADEGPILVDLRVRIGELDHESAVARTLQSLLKRADADQNGEVLWSELLEAAEFTNGQLGNNEIRSLQERKDAEYRCDLNRNKRVEPAEMLLFFLPDSQRSRRISFLSPPDAAKTKDSAPLFDWLDTTRDGTLDPAELDQVAVRLRLLDQNDDGRLLLTERPNTDVEASPRNSRSDRLATWMRPDADDANMLFLLEDRYALGSPLRADDFPYRKGWFEPFDEDQDGVWSLDEFRKWKTATPDLVIELTFVDGSVADAQNRDAAQGRKTVGRILCPDVSEVPVFSGIAVPVQCGGTTMDVQVVDAALTLTGTPADFPAWDQWDSDHNGTLSDEEYQRIQMLFRAPLKSIDTDGDSCVTAKELALAAELRQFAMRDLLVLQVREDATPLWSALDTNHDEQLSERELSVAGDKLRTLLAGRSVLPQAALPRSWHFEVRRGSTDDAAGRPLPVDVISTIKSPGSDTAPAWFRQLDSNSDGDVSWREFLGPRDQFDSLDRNHDEFLDASESRL